MCFCPITKKIIVLLLVAAGLSGGMLFFLPPEDWGHRWLCIAAVIGLPPYILSLIFWFVTFDQEKIAVGLFFKGKPLWIYKSIDVEKIDCVLYVARYEAIWIRATRGTPSSSRKIVISVNRQQYRDWQNLIAMLMEKVSSEKIDPSILDIIRSDKEEQQQPMRIKLKRFYCKMVGRQ